MNISALVNIFAKRVIAATDYLDDDKVYLINQFSALLVNQLIRCLMMTVMWKIYRL